MNNKLLLTTVIVMVGSIAISAAPVSADSRTQHTNGCTIVPDVTPWSDFHNACNKHDICYARYSNGLHRYGETEISRKICDDQFLGRMYKACKSRVWREEPACMATALQYYNGVRRLGVPFYYDNNTLK
jgi:hypothetical protein